MTMNQQMNNNAELAIRYSKLNGQMTTENKHYFTQIIQAQLQGWATLPHGLGLDMPVYKQLLNATNNAALIAYDAERSLATGSEFKQRSSLIKDLTAMKMAERNELVELLFHHARLETPYATQAAIVVATGCLSPSHLWKTLGFSNRQELYDFLNHNFPSLVELNDKNMRWKRFFYLQLCNNGGDYVCRSPSCDTCTSYNECFVTDA